MKYEEFKEKLSNMHYVNDIKYLSKINNNNVVIHVIDNRGHIFFPEYPIAKISCKFIDSFSFNPNKERSWDVHNDICQLVKEYASTPINERKSDERDKEISELKDRISSLESANVLDYVHFSDKILSLENDMATIKYKKPRWFK